MQPQTCSKQAIEAAIGPESFQPNDFVIFNKLGALRVRNVHSGSVLGSVDEADEEALTRVNVFAATYESGRPFQGPVTVLLKEYLPGSRQVGLNDIRTCSALQVCPVQTLTACALSLRRRVEVAGRVRTALVLAPLYTASLVDARPHGNATAARSCRRYQKTRSAGRPPRLT